MNITKTLTMIAMAGGLLALAAPVEAQNRGHGRGGGGGHGGGGNMNHGGNHHGNPGYRHGHRGYYNNGRVNFYFGGFGYPYYYGFYPYYSYPYYGYPYGYPAGSYYTYDPRGIYQGRLANPSQTINDGGGKDLSMATRVQEQLASAGYYRGAIDGIIGEGTRRAIRNYERDNGLVVDGRIDERLLSTMGLG